MRSFFSTLLLLNWGLLLFLVVLGAGLFKLSDFIHDFFHPFLLFFYVLIAIYGTFFLSSEIAKKVIDPLSSLERKTKEINAGDFGSELGYPDIRELANLTLSINEMASRLQSQFLDLNVEKGKFNSLLQNLKEGVFAIDQNSKFLFLNQKIPSSLIQPNSQFKDSSSSISNLRLKEFIQDRINIQSEGKLELQEGVNFYSIRFYPVKTNEIIYLYIGVISEVTEDKQYQMIREQFFQNASHELKTPITSIKGYAETLQFKFEKTGDSNTKRFLDAILRNTERMIRIVDDMLTVTKLEQHTTYCQREYFFLKDLVHNITETVGVILSNKSQTYVLQIPENLQINADIVLLEHVLINLISNASAYSPENTKILVKAHETSDQFVLQVIDQGIGIAPEDQERIFERFYRVDSNRSRKEGGTGLGLSIVKHIAKLHEGEISVKPNPEGGSIFTFEFPKKAGLRKLG